MVFLLILTCSLLPVACHLLYAAAPSTPTPPLPLTAQPTSAMRLLPFPCNRLTGQPVSKEQGLDLLMARMDGDLSHVKKTMGHALPRAMLKGGTVRGMMMKGERRYTWKHGIPKPWVEWDTQGNWWPTRRVPFTLRKVVKRKVLCPRGVWCGDKVLGRGTPNNPNNHTCPYQHSPGRAE